jgi:hypothetical protein
MTVVQNPVNPTITPQEVENQLARHLGLDLNFRYTEFYRTVNEEVLFQGDVIKLPYKLKRKVGADHALLLSNTCDMTRTREQRVMVIPLRPFPDPSAIPVAKRPRYQSLYDTVVKYKNTTYVYLPPVPNNPPLSSFDAMFGAFSEAVSLDSEAVNDLVSGANSKRLVSLNQIGHYIFMIKIAVHFLRPDDRFPTLAS